MWLYTLIKNLQNIWKVHLCCPYGGFSMYDMAFAVANALTGIVSYSLDYYTYTIKVAGITDSASIQTKAGSTSITRL